MEKVSMKSNVLAYALGCFLAAQVSAHGQNVPGPGNNGNSEANLNGCRKTHCVLVKLPNERGAVGSLELYTKNENGQYQKVLGPCSASGGVSPHDDGAPSLKTPAGVHGVLDTADQLLYNGHYVNMYNATYFHDPDLLNIRTSNRMAIHSGHIDGQNSHGCVRTTATCAQKVRQAADNSGLDMQVKIAYY
jgi:hypothetical protein